jgi:hypothetical protein
MGSMDAVARRSLLIAPILLLLSQACDTTPPSSSTEGKERPLTAKANSKRSIFENCKPAEEVERYADMVGKKVLITWAWQQASDRAASLEVPAVVLRLDSPYVVVDFDRRIPSLEIYTFAWQSSGHIKAMPDGAYGVDPCSATLNRGQW